MHVQEIRKGPHLFAPDHSQTPRTHARFAPGFESRCFRCSCCIADNSLLVGWIDRYVFFWDCTKFTRIFSGSYWLPVKLPFLRLGRCGCTVFGPATLDKRVLSSVYSIKIFAFKNAITRIRLIQDTCCMKCWRGGSWPQQNQGENSW